jgi:hypothetical protein
MIAVCLLGCVAPRFHNTVADVGDKPINYEQTIRNHLHTTLLDPYSIQGFRVSNPVSSECMIGLNYAFYGWRVDTQYNAKNAYGAYTGLKRYFYWFHGERLRLVTSEPRVCPEGW